MSTCSFLSHLDPFASQRLLEFIHNADLAVPCELASTCLSVVASGLLHRTRVHVSVAVKIVWKCNEIGIKKKYTCDESFVHSENANCLLIRIGFAAEF